MSSLSSSHPDKDIESLNVEKSSPANFVETKVQEKINVCQNKIEKLDSSDTDYQPSSNEVSSSEDEFHELSFEDLVISKVNSKDGKSLYKLKFEDVEECRKKQLARFNIESDSETVDEIKPSCSNVKLVKFLQPGEKLTFSEYCQTFSHEYDSDEDDHFNPIYCGESLSEDEDLSTDSNFESDVEIETLNELNKRTGEKLLCLKFSKSYADLPLPHQDSSENAGTSSSIES